MEEVFLNDVWVMYFHDPFDVDWTNKSYHRMGDISTVADFWDHMKSLQKHVQNGMFFLMREHVFPCWDDPENIKGGCLSMKVLKEDIVHFWQHLSMQLVGETLLKPEHRDKHWNDVNGISVSPKKNFCIVKIWLRDPVVENKDWYDVLKVYHGDIMFKLNHDSINSGGLQAN